MTRKDIIANKHFAIQLLEAQGAFVLAKILRKQLVEMIEALKR